MISFINENLVKDSLSALGSAVEFRVLYDLGEIPEKLKEGKDIDILVRPKDVRTCASALRKLNFLEVVHPNIADIYIYGAPRRRMFMKQGLYFDIHSRLVVRSLDAGQWLPLDAEIQNAAWDEADSSVCGASLLPAEVEFCYLIARCIFDKKSFPEAQHERISELAPIVDEALVHSFLSKVFFAFTPVLLSVIAAKKWEDIIPTYFKFKDY